jgi:hypothetical protein
MNSRVIGVGKYDRRDFREMVPVGVVDPWPEESVQDRFRQVVQVHGERRSEELNLQSEEPASMRPESADPLNRLARIVTRWCLHAI